MMENIMELNGVWQFGFDKNTKDMITLPNTTETACKGEEKIDKEQTLYLSRRYSFTGKSYYEKEIELSDDWNNKEIFLCLERTKYTKIWIDEVFASASHETLVMQKHNITPYLNEGKHKILIEVDNDLSKYDDFSESLYNGHQYTEHTQTNWNGIIGEIYLEAKNNIYINNIEFIKQNNNILVKVCIFNKTEEKNIKISIEGFIEQSFELSAGNNEITFIFEINNIKLWDEFEQNLYEFTIHIKDLNDNVYDSKKEKIGFRDIKIKDKEIFINNNAIFLRGNVDCCIFPKTGHAPMTEKEWVRIFEIMKSYGINHYRFHSWCPPESAFCAADRLGMYLQIELSCFANGMYGKENEKYDEALNNYLYQQAKQVLKQYGNHPSFVMFAVGNEMVGELEEYNKILRELKMLRPDKLFSQGSNNFLENPICCEEDDFWVIMRTTKTDNVRASFSYGDKPLGYLQMGNKASSINEYSKALEKSKIPLISHEIGQYQVYPNFDEIEKYTGVLYPTALDIFQKRLEEKELEDLAKDYFKASGALALLCYREDIEASMRTEKMTGFQLLDLQDFPGQGTALVGILDSFMDSKGLITPEKFREFCNNQVILAKLPKYTYTIGEDIIGEILFYNFGKSDIKNVNLKVELLINNVVVKNIVINNIDAKKSQLTAIGKFHISTERIKNTTKAELKLSCENLKNHYDIWLYEDEEKIENSDILVVNYLNDRAKNMLQNGGKVLLLTSKAKNSIEGAFTSDFWCWSMFGKSCEERGLEVAAGSLGLLIDENHDIFKHYPTEYHSNWQWKDIVYHSRPIILDDTEKNFRPIVQVIDNFDRNHKLGLVFEAKVGNGNLLVCANNLLDIIQEIEVKTFYNAIIKYMQSENFNPENRIGIDDLEKILY